MVNAVLGVGNRLLSQSRWQSSALPCVLGVAAGPSATGSVSSGG